jgi:hypothetical protein
MGNLPGIGSLWVEGDLSFLEQLCLLSFVDQGHPVTLFHYGPVGKVPDGIDLVDAREVHDPKKIIINKQFGTPVPQSDVFRLHMLAKTDLIWVDTDVLALKPFEDQSHIFGYFQKRQLCNAILRLPKSSPALADYMDYVADEYPIPPWLDDAERADWEAQRARGELKHASEQAHSVYGPKVLTWFAGASGEISHAKPVPAYYPVPFRQAGEISDLTSAELTEKYLRPETVAVHLWGRRIRWWIAGRGVRRYSLLDRKLRLYGIDRSAAPVIDPNGARKAARRAEKRKLRLEEAQQAS